MPSLNWEVFAGLPGATDTNFENLCRNLISRHYARYGDLVALANQPGVEFHLKLRSSCALGEPGRWYGWQCRWYGLPSGHAIGSARRAKIEAALEKTKQTLPDLTDWVLWTRYPLTKADQDWFYALSKKPRLALWTSANVEELLTGDAQLFRSTYFGELVLTPDLLAKLHKISVAQVQGRWLPLVHQQVDAERKLRQMLGEASSWALLKRAAGQLEEDVVVFTLESAALNGEAADTSRRLRELAQKLCSSLKETHAALGIGDLGALRQQLASRVASIPEGLFELPRHLRALRHRCALIAANVVDDIDYALELLKRVANILEKQIVAVLADAGGGKTQLAAQLTYTQGDRPAGILLHGSNLSATGSLDDLAHYVKISSLPIVSMEALLAAVDAAGERSNCRLPIVIDGLNEAEDPRRWKALLAALDKSLANYPYVLVICTVRPAFADESLPEEATRLEMPDFGEDRISAIRKYFNHYKINPTDAFLPLELLRHPLTLRLFCEVTNPKRQNVVGIEAMPQSLTALFDKYLDQAADRVAQLAPRSNRYYQQDVRAAYEEIGLALWENAARSLDVTALRGRLHDIGRTWNESIVALEQEGVLLRHNPEALKSSHVAPMYDALGGHLVAGALLSKYGRNELETWVRNPDTVAKLAEAGPQQHPLAGDIFRALVGQIPRKLYSQQLWPMLDPPLRTIALETAAELEGTYLDAATVRELSSLVKQAPGRGTDLFRRLWQTRGAVAHPLNAKFLDDVLRPLKLPERDLRWTEWIRSSQKDRLDDLSNLEKRWRNTTYELDRAAERLRIRWVMWLLASTVVELRDKATRALYWYGRRDPSGLFVLTLDSLTINDPYISERMLAASYGVCMALHCRPKRRIFRQRPLPAFAKDLYKQMFAPGAPYSTTHVLSRDYARRIIDIARLHAPSLLTKDEEVRILPPYKEGGIREWQAIEDPNKEKYRGGNSPLGMDFANYTIGRLVPERGNYQDHPEYTKVLGQIVWRLYELGYSLEAFGDIDKNIAGSEFHYEMRGERHAERYGKKYARIAFFEQYGLRQDQGLLKDRWSEEEKRPSDSDLDPSFPDPPHKFRVVPDLLGDRSGDIGNWVKQGPMPAFAPCLIQAQVGPKSGPWILLGGYRRQHEKISERIGFVIMDAFFMLDDDVSELVRLVKAYPPRARLLPDSGEDHYTFAGEIPWCDTFPQDELRTIDFVVGSVNKRIPKNDPRFRYRFILDFGGSEEVIEHPKQYFEKVDILSRIPIYLPVRESRFSSEGNLERPSGEVPGKYLAKQFGLWLDLPNWDMRNQDGKLSSITTSEGNHDDYEHHLFLKKEHIDDLLESRGLALLWDVWGERQHYAERHSMSSSPSGGYEFFRQVYRYAHGRPRRLI